MRLTTSNPYPSFHLEGALLSRDLIARLTQPVSDLPHVSEQSYHLDGQRLREVINASWNDMRGRWTRLQDELSKLPSGDLATSRTRELFLLPLLQELGFGRVQRAPAIEAAGKSYAISHRWEDVPIHLLGAGVDLDKRTPGVAGAAQTSPHALVQEALNRSGDHLWAILSNGRRWRLLRDNASLSRRAFIEWDLETLFENELSPDWALLWMLCHQSRFERREVNGETARPILEEWVQQANQEGTRALDRLRDGVEQAITTLGSGFLKHPANTALRSQLSEGTLSTTDFYRYNLRIVYRMLFVLVAEVKDALLLSESSEGKANDAATVKAITEARARYLRYFSMDRLRRIAAVTRGTAHADAWQGLRLVFDLLRGADPQKASGLALPALGGFLFDTMPLDGGELANADLYAAVRDLCFFEQNGVRRAVNFHLGSEELGSVYESLLELHPQIDVGGRSFELVSAAGNERKTTGSYYTATGLVKSLLDSALQPVLDAAAARGEAAILDLKICDPACGSGHFLTAAARRVADALARVRSGGDEPTRGQSDRALREVVGRCIYGVDVNPMAVELCKVALWMEALEPGRPLSFLDRHIRAGNSLLGATPELLEHGIPDEAFAPLEGDDPKVCTALKKQNKQERQAEAHRARQGILNFGDGWHLDLGDLRGSIARLEAISDNTLEDVRAKELMLQALYQSSAYLFTHQLAHAWCAAFVWRKVPDTQPDYLPPITHEVFLKLRSTPFADSNMVAEIKWLSEQYEWFHWHIEFPEVFENGHAGFDVVLGNPPWERVKLQEKEWFSLRLPAIANAPNAAARQGMILQLVEDDLDLLHEFYAARRLAEGESHFARNSGRYPLCGRGDVNTYALFAELNRTLVQGRGRVGCIVPSGIATDDTTKLFFQSLNDNHNLVSLFDFENREGIFPGVHRAYKFCLLTLTGSSGANSTRLAGAQFVFFATRMEHLDDPERRFTLSAADIALLNPNTRTCPIFRSRSDAELTKTIYRRVPVLIEEAKGETGNPWDIKFSTMFHMSNDSALFRTIDDLEEDGCSLSGNVWQKDEETYLPLYEAKMMAQYDHRSSSVVLSATAMVRQGQSEYTTDEGHKDPSYLVMPRFWVREPDVRTRLDAVWKVRWLLGFRDVTAVTNERTVIVCILPLVGAGHTIPLILPQASTDYIGCLLANLSTFVLDYIARQKIGGLHLTYGYLKQLPILPTLVFRQVKAWTCGIPLAEWVAARVLELTYTAYDLTAFARDLGYTGEPFRWDVERRFQLRCELDAAFFRLYGISHDDAAYIMDTFLIVRRKDEAAFGEYRTKRRILEIYDAMHIAQENGTDYTSPLDPPPGDARAAHASGGNT